MKIILEESFGSHEIEKWSEDRVNTQDFIVYTVKFVAKEKNLQNRLLSSSTFAFEEKSNMFPKQDKFWLYWKINENQENFFRKIIPQ